MCIIQEPLNFNDDYILARLNSALLRALLWLIEILMKFSIKLYSEILRLIESCMPKLGTYVMALYNKVCKQFPYIMCVIPVPENIVIKSYRISIHAYETKLIVENYASLKKKIFCNP